jgi:hypothetical protein
MMTASLALTLAALAAGADSRPIDFSREVRPILSNYCFQCHGPDDKARKAKLRLDESAAATAELPSGHRAIVPGKPKESELLVRLTTEDAHAVMPPAKLGKKPKAGEVETLRRWIAQGAAYTKHWAYVAPVRPPLPAVSDPSWTLNPIDRFILARLDREGLRPAPATDRYTLLRRVSLDLTGLPPTPEEADRFANDPRPDAYEKAVDDLLARSSYGERWASIWLDLARYGDSVGYIHDPPRTIWRWRDWLVQVLNDNRPYDRLTVEMLAGDLLPNPTREQVIATGFHRNTTCNTEGGANAEEYRFAAVVDRVNTTMQVWMGSTFACAQCHNHKYDPFSQKEYYQLFAIFNNTADNNTEEPILDVPRPGREAEFAALSERIDRAKALLAEASRRRAAPSWLTEAGPIAAPAAYRRFRAAEWSARNDELKRLQVERDRVATTTLVMREAAVRPAYVAIRGDYQNRGEAVNPGVPAALHPASPGTKLDRLALARWLVDSANPLTARVAVNRLWQEVFGVGIVETAEEFGMQGEPPSHPELLDWLATEYVRLGWDTKKLLKLIVTSATYRQSSRANAELAQRDPANRLLARGPRVRLSAEALRDQALAVSGLLSPRMFGSPVHPHQPVNGLAAAFGPSTDWENGRGEDAHRRALYTHWRRNLPYPSMLAFDVPERAACSVRRIRTNTPLQALVTLNDPVFVEAAQALARRILAEGGSTPESRAARGFRLALVRPPSDAELRRLVALYTQSRAALAADPARAAALAAKPIGPVPPGLETVEAAAWTVVGNVLLNLDEVVAKP